MSSAGILQPIALDNATAERWPIRFRATLAKLVGELSRQRRGAPVTVEPIRELRRPFSTVLHVRVVAGQSRRTAFVKILQPRADTPAELAATRRNVQREHDVTVRVMEALDGVDGLGAVRAIACFPEEFALATEEVAGHTLSSVLSRRLAGWPAERTIDELADALRRASSWLLATQRSLRPDREVSADTITRYLDRRLDELSASPGGMLTTAGRDRLKDFRDRLLRSCIREDLQAVWIHADFCPDNIILSPSGVTVLDFTMAGGGTKYHDLSHLALSLDAMRGKPWLNRAALDRLQAALLNGFEPGLDTSHPLFMLARFQHVLCHLVAIQDVQGRLARLHGGIKRRRYQSWLSRVAGVGPEGWVR